MNSPLHDWVFVAVLCIALLAVLGYGINILARAADGDL